MVALPEDVKKEYTWNASVLNALMEEFKRLSSFATTVVGLVISAVGLISMQFKQRWYAKDVNNLDYVSRVLNETTGESNNEKK